MKSSGQSSVPKKIDIDEFLSLFNKFSRKEKMKIAERIAQEIFEDRWKMLDNELPDVKEISEESIMQEVVAVRRK